jgi:DNA-binding response OmpR family regulator
MDNQYALIIENNVKNAKYFAKKLTRDGFDCQVVVTGSQAQIQLAFTLPDLIVLNTNLPDLPAEAILRQVKALRWLRNTRLLIVGEERQLVEVMPDQVDLSLRGVIR